MNVLAGSRVDQTAWRGFVRGWTRNRNLPANSFKPTYGVTLNTKLYLAPTLVSASAVP